MEKGTLYICATPIGNLEDITLRTIRVLKEVDLIAAEDTRHTIRLLNHFEIKNPLTSYHEHNVKEKGGELIAKLKSGMDIALVSDAGMPGISDPGADLVSLAIENGIQVLVLPGPTASITALVLSGLNTDKFIFEGFLSSKKSHKKRELESIKHYKKTTIIYESPHRILSTLKDINDILGDRNISVSRELTKKYEETFRGTAGEALEKFNQSKVRGEFVIVVEGNTEEEKTEEIDIREELDRYVEEGYSNKEAIKLVAEEHNIPKNTVYAESLKR